jgi:DNA-binding GntR family transcriptional regulator
MGQRTAGIIRHVQAAYARPMPLVDHDSPVPLYAQLAAELRRRITEERLARLPSYVTLMQEHGVSRETAERAVHVLIDAGEAYVVSGKGTYAGQPGE